MFLYFSLSLKELKFYYYKSITYNTSFGHLQIGVFPSCFNCPHTAMF